MIIINVCMLSQYCYDILTSNHQTSTWLSLTFHSAEYCQYTQSSLVYNKMSFRDLRSLTEMMRTLGYPRLISLENFRQVRKYL